MSDFLNFENLKNSYVSKPLFIEIYIYIFPINQEELKKIDTLEPEAAHAATAVPSTSLLSVPTGSDLPPPAGPANTAKHGITLESLDSM